MYFNARRFSQSEYLCIFHLAIQSPCIFMHFSTWRFNRRVFFAYVPAIQSPHHLFSAKIKKKLVFLILKPEKILHLP